jgi:hypothetical protein
VHHTLCGLAANPALPSELVDRLISIADEDIAMDLACRADLSGAQAVALAERIDESAVQLAYAGRLTSADIDPSVWPDAALALGLRAGTGASCPRRECGRAAPDASPADRARACAEAGVMRRPAAAGPSRRESCGRAGNGG